MNADKNSTDGSTATEPTEEQCIAETAEKYAKHLDELTKEMQTFSRKNDPRSFTNQLYEYYEIRKGMFEHFRSVPHHDPERPRQLSLHQTQYRLGQAAASYSERQHAKGLQRTFAAYHESFRREQAALDDKIASTQGSERDQAKLEKLFHAYMHLEESDAQIFSATEALNNDHSLEQSQDRDRIRSRCKQLFYQYRDQTPAMEPAPEPKPLSAQDRYAALIDQQNYSQHTGQQPTAARTNDPNRER